MLNHSTVTVQVFPGSNAQDHSEHSGQPQRWSNGTQPGFLPGSAKSFLDDGLEMFGYVYHCLPRLQSHCKQFQPSHGKPTIPCWSMFKTRWLCQIKLSAAKYPPLLPYTSTEPICPFLKFWSNFKKLFSRSVKPLELAKFTWNSFHFRNPWCSLLVRCCWEVDHANIANSSLGSFQFNEPWARNN